MAKTGIVRKLSGLVVLEFTVESGGEAQGTIRKIQDTHGLVWDAEETFSKTLTAGKTGTAIVKCDEALLPKVTGSGTAFAIGDTIWFSEANLNVSPTESVTYDKNIGSATQVAAITDTGVYGQFDFNYYAA